MNDLARTAAALVAPGKGVLAADESTATMSSRLQKAGVEPSAENRRAYRELLLTTPGLAGGVSGIIFSDEIFRQQLADGAPFPAACADRGILAGIKVDTGTSPLPGAAPETVTEGLDGLRGRLADYRGLGARFAKWRGVLRIEGDLPSRLAIEANAHALARYAALCQEAGIVPIVEPEVLMDGSHDLRRCATVTAAVLSAVFEELATHRVAVDGMVLKPNMVLPGSQGPASSDEDIASATVDTLSAAVPPEVPGIAFLSGGQTPADATRRLRAIRHLRDTPWALTFSFGRALVDPALAAWHGDPALVGDGQRALAERVAGNVAALRGEPEPAPA